MLPILTRRGRREVAAFFRAVLALAMLAILSLVALWPVFAFAEELAAAPAPSLLETLATPTNIAAAVFSVLGIVAGLMKLTDRRKQQIALAVHHAFHFVEDIAPTTDNKNDDKAALGLKALDEYLLANGWRSASKDELERAKLGFTALNGAMKAEAKVKAAAVALAGGLQKDPQ